MIAANVRSLQDEFSHQASPFSPMQYKQKISGLNIAMKMIFVNIQNTDVWANGTFPVTLPVTLSL